MNKKRTSTAATTVSALLIAAVSLLSSSCSEPVIPQGYALVYGVSDYTEYRNSGLFNKADDLVYTANDAKDMASVLEENGWKVYLRINDGSETGTLPATLAQLENDVTNLKLSTNPEDRLFFFYSGHGGQLQYNSNENDDFDESLFLYIDHSFNTVTELFNLTLIDDTMKELFIDIKASTRTVVLDCCNSGGFIGDGFTVEAINPDYKKYKAYSGSVIADTIQLFAGFTDSGSDLPGNSFVVLAAAGEPEESYDGDDRVIYGIKNGYFTYFIKQSPTYADYNKDGWITATEAYEYAVHGANTVNNKASFIFFNYSDYMPRVSAFPVDPVLFRAK